MAGVIESALARVRAEDEALTPVRMPFELRPLLRLVVEANREAAAAKGIALMLDPGPPIRIDADEELLLLALDNLVSNGIKYGSAGVTVRVSARIEDGAAVLAVADDGPGLGADDLARVFGRFATLSARPTGGESSTGLGLANVRAVAEAHGGSVSATSAGPGRGAVFAILLPPGTGATGAAAAGAPRD
jgi:signal transduction histidine kinase